MSMSRTDAMSALNEMERAQARSLDTRVYRSVGLQLIGWGVVWMVGYGLTGFRPQWASLVWTIADLAGVLFSFLVVRRHGLKGRAVPWRWMVIGLAVFLFFVGTYTVLPIRSGASAGVFPALLVSLVYAIAGGLRFTRLLWIGAALFCLTMGGYFLFSPTDLMFWMAGVGGGALMLGGLWLTRA